MASTSVDKTEERVAMLSEHHEQTAEDHSTKDNIGSRGGGKNENGKNDSTATALLRQHLVVFIVLLLLSVLSAVCVAVTVLSAIEMADHANRELHLETIEQTSVVISKVAIELVEQSLYAVQGNSFKNGAMERTDFEFEKLMGKKKLSDKLKSAKAALVSARSGVSSSSSIESFIPTYQNVFELLIKGGNELLKEGSENVLSTDQLGHLCTFNEFLRFFDFLTLLNTPMGKPEEFINYLAVEGPFNTANCYADFLPAHVVVNIETIMRDAAAITVDNVRNKVPASLQIPAAQQLAPENWDELSVQMRERSYLMRDIVQFAVDSTEKERTFERKWRVVALVMYIVATVTVICALCAAAYLTHIHISSQTSMSDIKHVFKRVELAAKQLPRYSAMLQACAVKDTDIQLQEAQQDIFFSKIPKFIKKIRPYFSQTAFGELETVTLQSATQLLTRSAEVADNIVPEQSIRELHAKDLRTETGMHLVAATVMAMSTAQFNGKLDYSLCDPHNNRRNGEELAYNVDYMAPLMSDFLSHAERVINGYSGVISTVTGDFLFALWNVTSVCSHPAGNAVRAALDMMDPASPLQKDLSLGIAQGFAIAGSVELHKRKQLAICGQAVSLAERLQLRNTQLGSNCLVDQTVAESIFSTVLTEACDYYVRPAILFKSKTDSDEVVAGHAVYRARFRIDKLKAWNATFKELTARVQKGEWDEAQAEIDKYYTTYCGDSAAISSSSPSGVGVGSASKRKGVVQQDPVVEYWRKLLPLKQDSERKKSNASRGNAARYGV